MIQATKPLNYYVEYNSIFKLAEAIATNFFNCYRSVFTNSAIDRNDLKQEAFIVVVTTLEKYKDQNKTAIDLRELSKKALKWKLTDLKDYAKRQIDTVSKECYQSEDNYNKEEEQRFNQQDEIEQETQALRYPLAYNDELLHEVAEKNNTGFKFEELYVILEENEYYVLYEILKNRKTLQSIGEEQHCSKEWIRQVYNRALKKAQRYLQLK